MRALACLLLLLAAPAFASGLLEKNHPLIDEGMKAFNKNDYEGALRAFDGAKAALPDNAVIEFNRGAALHKLGRNDEARTALLRAAELDKGELSGPIHYNLGNVWAATGNKKEAVTEYRKALRADPNDPMARHNLEVILRDLQRQNPSSGPDGGSDGGNGDAGKPDAGTDGGKPQDGGRPADGGSKPDGGSPDGGADGGTDGGSKGPSDGGNGDGGQGDGGQGQKTKPGDGGTSNEGGDGGTIDAGTETKDAGSTGEEGPDDVMDGGASMSKKDAEKLLDSMKNSEKNLQLWRFQQKRQRKPNGKDW